MRAMRVTYISNMRVRIPETKRKKERKKERERERRFTFVVSN